MLKLGEILIENRLFCSFALLQIVLLELCCFYFQNIQSYDPRLMIHFVHQEKRCHTGTDQ